MRPFIHVEARNITAAVAALGKYQGRARLNAGGTDLLGLLKDEFLPGYPEAIINIKTVAGLNHIREEKGVLKIGALTTLAEIAEAPLLKERYDVIAAAAHAVASPQIRNAATIGGNLCQDVRCSYYRYPRHIGGPIDCARKGNGPCLAVKGDNRLHAIIGGRKCFAVCPSDLAVALAALDGRIAVVGPNGKRRVAIRDFHTPMGNLLEQGEIVTEIEVPVVNERLVQNFLKFTLRRPIDFAIVSVATVVKVADGVCTEARIALGGVACGAYRAVAAELFLKGKPLDDATAARAGELAVKGAKKLSRNGYKIEIAKTLVKRGLIGESLPDCPCRSDDGREHGHE